MSQVSWSGKSLVGVIDSVLILPLQPLLVEYALALGRKVRRRGMPPVHPVECQCIIRRLATEVLHEDVEAMGQMDPVKLWGVFKPLVFLAVEVIKVRILADKVQAMDVVLHFRLPYIGVVAVS